LAKSLPFLGEKKKKNNNNNKGSSCQFGGVPQSHSKSFTHLLCLTLLALTNVLQDSKTICWEDVQRWVLQIWLVPTTTSIQQLNYLQNCSRWSQLSDGK
jgi:hypothetical protein